LACQIFCGTPPECEVPDMLHTAQCYNYNKTRKTYKKDNLQEMKLKKTIIFALLVITTSSCGQTPKKQVETPNSELFSEKQFTFTVEDFSKDYVGIVYISDTTEVFTKGWIAILEKKSKKQIIKVESEELAFELHNGELLANVKELPYGEQSLIMYEDYNFDGKKDFAIMDGQNSCYHGPSFQIYLATDNGFEYSEEFTSLAQEYCGMFDVDYDKKQIFTMTKDGCCWHEYSTFVVENNRPIAVEIRQEGLNPTGVMWDIVEQKRIDGKMTTQKYSVFNTDGETDVVYSFEFSNKKKMRLLNNSETLYYIFTDKDDKVELCLWDEGFNYSKKDNTLEFESGETSYKITSTGIIVTTPNKKYDMKAVPETIKGSMTDMLKMNLENVTIKNASR